MPVRSLVTSTDIGVAGESCSVIERDDCVVIVTPSQPSYYWGNFVVMPRPPADGDLVAWEDVFTTAHPEMRHRAFTWDVARSGYELPEAFAAAGYELESVVALTAPTDIVVDAGRTLPVGMQFLLADPAQEAHWRRLVDLAVMMRPASYADASYFSYAVERYAVHRRAVRDGRARWVLGVHDGNIIASLGIYACPAGRARYQDVMTHPGYRNQGVASALLVHAASEARASWPTEVLVIVAETDGDAHRLYERVGFSVAERNDGILRRPEDG